MTVIQQLASSQGIRSSDPNKELAKELAGTGDSKAIKELVDNLKNKDKNIQSDCIKVLYELGEIRPQLISGYAKEFIALLDNKNNRLQWGAMTALDMITQGNPKLIYNALGKIIDIADKGSVITTDHCVGILLKLCAEKEYADDAFTLFLDQLRNCPTNQLPAYAEKAVPLINSENKGKFLKILNDRIRDVEKDSKRKRVDKVIKILG
jgi:hypothetical protein